MFSPSGTLTFCCKQKNKRVEINHGDLFDFYFRDRLLLSSHRMESNQ